MCFCGEGALVDERYESSKVCIESMKGKLGAGRAWKYI